VCVCVCVCVCAQLYLCMFLCMCVRVCVCAHVHVYVVVMLLPLLLCATCVCAALCAWGLNNGARPASALQACRGSHGEQLQKRAAGPTPVPSRPLHASTDPLQQRCYWWAITPRGLPGFRAITSRGLSGFRAQSRPAGSRTFHAAWAPSPTACCPSPGERAHAYAPTCPHARASTCSAGRRWPLALL